MTRKKYQRQRLEELRGSYESQTKRVQALRRDVDRAIDSEHRLILEERLSEAERRREEIVNQIGAIETVDEELRKAEVPKRVADLREISNYVIVGLEAQHQLRPIFEMFSGPPSANASVGQNQEFEETPFNDFGEMTDVFTALTSVLNSAKQRGGSENALMKCLKDEVIDRASRNVLPSHSASQTQVPPSLGVDYMIWSVRKEWASVIRALRIKQMLSGEVEIRRTIENEIIFDDIRKLQVMATTLQEAASAGKNSQNDFMRLVLQGAMRAQFIDLDQ